MSANTEPTALDLLAAKFPGWKIWRSDAGRLWATRYQPVTDAEVGVGIYRTVDADDLDELKETLTEQKLRAAEVSPP